MSFRRFPYCGCYVFVDFSQRYLPQLKVNAHTTILDTTSRTTLTQVFANPYKDKAIDELSYAFPLYDGVSVVAFTCTVADRVIKGVVKERQKAKHEYTEAKARGETAGLFEQSLEASDVFTTTIGNVPAGELVKVEITYLGELKHDAEVDGVRFTIPTHIVPRYGKAESLESKGNWFKDEGISITVDAEMPNGSAIKSIQSPSHPISVSIGTTSTASASEEPSLRKASATLSQGATSLDKDFIVQVVATKMGEPAAFVETHPTIPNQRALMATLVPKFKLPAEKPEIVFICDRSGSMHGNIPDLVAALNIFLKSLPLGVKFNICSFGSRFSFLWSKSKTYSQDSLDKAVRHINGFAADYGGTEMYEPFKETFKKRYKDLNLEIFLLTDGAIWDQDRLFQLINEKVAESKGAVRIFSLGVGAGASTALIEGVARAGNGFAQTVGNDEKMDKKVVRMLKGALFPHITDYSLEIKYEKASTQESEEDDFEIVEKVLDSLSIKTLVEDEEEKKEEEKQPISLFDNKTDSDGDEEMLDVPGAIDAKYNHLPKIAIPRYLQTPTEIPPLYPFNRTSIYVLLSDSTPDMKPKSVLLKGTSKHGPLVLEIPIVNLAEKSTTIHQLAARKEVKELEEGRGWLSFAKDAEGKLLKAKHEGQFSDMVEQEAVRLGVEFQVGGKWCSFVAVEESTDESKNKTKKKELNEFGVVKPQEEISQDLFAMTTAQNMSIGIDKAYCSRARAPRPMYKIASAVGGLFDAVGSGFKSRSPNSSGGSLFGSQSAPPPPPPGSGLFGSSGAPPPSGGSLFGGNSGPLPPPPPPPPGSGLFGSSGAPPPSGGPFFGNSSAPPPPQATGFVSFGSAAPERSTASDGVFLSALRSSRLSGGLFGAAPAAPALAPAPAVAPVGTSFGFGSSNNSGLFGAPPSQGPDTRSTYGSAAGNPFAQAHGPMLEAATNMPLPDEDSEDGEGAVEVEKKAKKRGSRGGSKGRRSSPQSDSVPIVDTSKSLQALTSLQTFVGSWTWNKSLQMVLGITPEAVSKLSLPDAVKTHANKDTILATACAIMFFKKKLKADEEAWEMLVDKAEAWLEDQVGESKEDLEKLVEVLF